jgi:4-amino-4-deoxy-L-arabinose transferase-like glycosyltransferase
VDALKRIHPLLLPVTLFLLVIITRVPFTSNLLYSMDSGHFALAMEKFSVPVHQPHPPGYFLYVMLGRVFRFFTDDANHIFVSISIVFSAFAIVALYYLGKELHGRSTGVIAAAIGITSPNLWFHGEVALTYAAEAFFSTLIAFFCWRIRGGNKSCLWLSAVAMGIAGGFRQDTLIFLFPLWIYATKDLPLRETALSLVLMALVCLFWFIPMLRMTGGWDAYVGAFRELWTTNAGNFTVFGNGWPALKLYSATLLLFIVYGLGFGIFPLVLALYVWIRQGKHRSRDREQSVFFSVWVFPSILFYLLVFIHPANPGYSLILMPAFYILTALSLEFLCSDLQRIWRNNWYPSLAFLLVFLNACWFFLSTSPPSYRGIRQHDGELMAMLDGIRTFPPQETAVFVAKDYVFFSFRHIMYYLPEYRVYLVDRKTASTGETRITFWGENRETKTADGIDLPKGIDKVAILTDGDDCRNTGDEVELHQRMDHSGLCILSGQVMLLKSVFPGLRFLS